MTNLSADLVQQKQKLREKLRFRRQHFAANLDGMAQLAAFRVLPASLSELLATHATTGAYVAWRDEPDILPMLAGLAEAGALALPHHAGRVAEMHFRRWRQDESLVKGPWGTQQPADDAPIAVPDIIFCPLVGFDRRGGRIGQGGGHYDKFLGHLASAGKHIPLAAVLYDGELLPAGAIPVEEFDRPVPGVVLPSGFRDLTNAA